jgi:methionine biosynthesis protein MetW
MLDHQIILDWIESESAVLDLGCGNGKLLELLIKEKQVQAQGIEINQQAIHKCIIKGLNVLQEDIDSGLSDYPEKSVDYVILNQTFQQVKKPRLVLREALRVGKKTIVGFPNFLHISSRLKMCFGGKVPVTTSLPYEWYNTPNLHFFSISDFREYCKKKEIKIIKSIFITNNKKIRLFPNVFAEIGLFLLSKS